MIIIDYKDRRPIYEQIIERFEDLILKGALEPGVQIPSVRSLAIDLSINPNTIQRAYMELERKNYIYTVKGRGSFVTEGQQIKDSKKIEIMEQLIELGKEAIALGISKEEIIDKIRFIKGGQTL